ncbi:hypothetical protein SANT12839_092660 [Streptomyces antimycoticus]|uniref:Calcineurin-like phosphoesterase domain-containing protein n=1 Tax=Streptomyces antimycoticus TaxID=68175 RepID=A0A4D4KJM7_9ACTN|nr:hypothetical protein SANT12839_092660 [Streptomyces antimycoticus]
MQPRQTHEPQPGTRRRTFLRTTGLAAAGVAMTGLEVAPPAAAAPASGATGAPAWHPDPESPRFTLAVMPDTQYLFDGESIHPAPVEASFRYLLSHAREENIVFLSHLGDLTEHGKATEFGPIGRAFRLLDERGAAYSVVAGNHDLDSSTDDQRGRTPYLDAFGPRRFRSAPSFRGASPDGYNTYHTFSAAGREWLVLALDWRPSTKGITWAREVIAHHPRTPIILTTHELVYADHEGEEASFSTSSSASPGSPPSRRGPPGPPPGWSSPVRWPTGGSTRAAGTACPSRTPSGSARRLGQRTQRLVRAAQSAGPQRRRRKGRR